MAWNTYEDVSEFTRMPLEPDMETLKYWISRLEPIIRARRSEEIIIVFANRSGIEGDAVYAGTSAVIGIQEGEVNIYGVLGRSAKDMLVVDTDLAPWIKLVHEPDEHGVWDSPNGDSTQVIYDDLFQRADYYSKASSPVASIQSFSTGFSTLGKNPHAGASRSPSESPSPETTNPQHGSASRYRRKPKGGNSLRP
jgi:protein N-terminal amidase